MENKKIRLGIVGSGGIANGAHYPAYVSLASSVDVVAVCDIKIEKAAYFADRYAKETGKDTPKTYENYLEMLETEKLDAIDICTPNYLHSVIAVAALERGIHVLCEKPDAINVAEAEKMKAAAEASGKTLMVMRNNRFSPVAFYLKKYIEEGKMGEIYASRCGWIRRRGIPGKGGWFTTKAQSGGGPLIDLGVHFIDVTMWLMGNPKPVAVTGCTYSKFSGTNTSDSVHSNFGEKKDGGTFDVEDLAMGFIRFDNGACMQIEFSWASNIKKEGTFYELRGTKAGTILNGDTPFRLYTEENGTLMNIEPILPDMLSGHSGYISHFIDVIKNGKDPIFTPDQGLNMIKILEAIYKSAETGHEVLL